MFLWIKQNLSTIIVSIILIAAVSGVVVKMIKDRRAGKSSCGCGCQGCSMNGICHKKQ